MKTLTSYFSFLFILLFSSCHNNSKVTIGNLPKMWVQLTERDGQLVILKPCNDTNREVMLQDNKGKAYMYLEGYVDGTVAELVDIKEKDDTIIFKAQLPYDANPVVTRKIIWQNKTKGLATYVDEYNNAYTMVTVEHLSSYKTVEQPLVECDEDYEEEYDAEATDPIAEIQAVFNEYVGSEESTDSEDDKQLMLHSLEHLAEVTDSADLQLLINVWLYYDPTDFSVRQPIYQILETTPAESAAAIEWRMANPKTWEDATREPFAELPGLLRKLQGLPQ